MRSILLVDDDREVRELVSFKLGRLGVEVVTACDGEAGLEAVELLHPDLALLDWTMPKLSGLELCRLIRYRPDTTDIPVIILSAHADETDVSHALAAGADDYIVKPFNPSELLGRIEAVVARRATALASLYPMVPGVGTETRNSTCT